MIIDYPFNFLTYLAISSSVFNMTNHMMKTVAKSKFVIIY